MLLAALVLANVIPFFGAFQNLLGALTGAPIVFGWPALFYLRGCGLNGVSASRADLLACGLYLCLFLPVFTGLGTANALQDLVEDWNATNGGVFRC